MSPHSAQQWLPPMPSSIFRVQSGPRRALFIQKISGGAGFQSSVWLRVTRDAGRRAHLALFVAHRALAGTSTGVASSGRGGAAARRVTRGAAR
ncbi:hypothetical protein HPB50_018373 [Hyalomma asiaticum]|uniref:Uncharacterized protein n=1 Tax=Hyalomma asiaticum TaxID=266040 RepID=A0ACB7TJS9_HYAAI|nr:hypothetical protein HPB50_018373 [Hyalomma asiaticum]